MDLREGPRSRLHVGQSPCNKALGLRLTGLDYLPDRAGAMAGTTPMSP